MRRRFPLPLLLLGLLALPAAADPRPDILYTSRKEFVRVSPPRPLTLNANISQFAYDPLGLEVACTGSETSGEQTTYFVKTLDSRTGKELHRLTMSVPPDTDTWFRILGWTPSGKYLLLEQTQPKEDESGESHTDLVRWDLSADPPKLRPVDTSLLLPKGAQADGTFRYASPHSRWVLLRNRYTVNGKEHSMFQRYDAEQDTLRTLTTPEGTEIEGLWTVDSHLTVRAGLEHKRQQMDVVTGLISPLSMLNLDQPSTSRQYPDLMLTVDRKTQIDSTSSGGFGSTLLWVNCNRRLKQPLSVVGAGLTMGDDDPQAVWSPAGKQIAFLNHRDLYVTEVTLVPATESVSSEKYALGLKLTCPEERELATSNLKQIGLGIIQYTQDSDEKFPPAEGVDEAILPYIKSRSVFSVGSVHWAYHVPEKPDLASMDAPADYVLGTMDMPCGQVVLYGDGHVKALTQETLPGPQ